MLSDLTNAYLAGAFMMASIVAGLLFQHFWQQTGDKFFRSFSIAFWLLAIERVAYLLLNAKYEDRSFIYLIRFVAYIVIILAILNKNREKSKG